MLSAGCAPSAEDAELSASLRLNTQLPEAPELLRDEFLIQNPGNLDGGGSEWCGRLWGVCLEHSELEQPDFKKAVGAAWQERYRALGLRVQRNRRRSSTWEELNEQLLLLYPSSSKADRRALIMLRLRTWVLCFASDLLTEDRELLARRAEITAEYKATCEHALLTGHPAAYGMAGQLTPEEAGWLTSFSASISISFVCRDPSCLWFGRNDQWVIHRDQRHFRCSLCGKLYAPWSCSGGEVPFQKVVAIRSPVSSDTMCFGAKWPGSEADLWLLRQSEA